MIRGSHGHEGHIVVVGQWREGQGRVPAPYVGAVGAAGGTPVIFSTFDLPDEHIPEGVPFFEECDPDDASALDGAAGLVLPGGGDIDPSLYGRERHPTTRNINHRRDRYERVLLDVALERDLPILAICHGMQILNVHLGGTLEQNLADNRARLPHDHAFPRPEPAHRIQVAPGNHISEATGGGVIEVNSHHHQGLEGAAHPLVEAAWAEDGVLEGVVSSEHSWVVGVQWHPEVMAPVDTRQAMLFDAFVAAARHHTGKVERAAS